MKYIWLAKNLGKIALWILVIPFYIVGQLGPAWGIPLYIALVFLSSLIVTFTHIYEMGGHSGFGQASRAIFSGWIALYHGDFKTFRKRWSLPFTVFGRFCSPGYGLDGPTRDTEPIDAGDYGCQRHDHDMIDADERLERGDIDHKEHKRLKNQGDLRLMKTVIFAKTTMSGIYLLWLEISFIGRIIARTLYA